MFRIKIVFFIIIVVLFASDNVFAKVNRIYLPSPFSYHLIKEITELHLYNLIQGINQRGYRVQFFNEMEYSNIVHALEMRTGEFLRRGNDLISIVTELSSYFRFDASLDTFLEDNNITDTDIWMYLRDLEGEVGNSTTVEVMNLGMKTRDGRIFDFDFTIGSSGQFTQFSPILSYQMQDGLLKSLEDLLRRERVPPGYTLTLYLKDFSPIHPFIDDYRDIERINIGIIVENRIGKYVREVDWIVEETKPQLIYTNYSIETSIIASFHESAHELVRKVLTGDMTGDSSISILSSISYINEMWVQSSGMTNIRYGANYPNKDAQIRQMAVFLAGQVAEEIIISSHDYNEDIRAQFDTENALRIAYMGVCLGLSSWQEDLVQSYCPQSQLTIVGLSYQEWKEWESRHLPGALRQSFIQNVNRWMDEAKFLARNVLIRNFRVLEDMTDLVLRKNTLNDQDLEMFYNDFPQITVSVSLNEENFQQPTSSFFNDTFQVNALNWNLALLPSSSFTSYENPGNINFQVQDIESGTVNVLRTLRVVDVAENIRPYIRRAPVQYEVQSAYGHGISSLYIKECIQIIKDFYSHL